MLNINKCCVVHFIFSSGSKTFRLNLLFAQVDVFEAAERYQKEGIPLIILAGKDYGSGNSRDWVAKGPYLLVSLSFFFLHVMLNHLRFSIFSFFF